MDSQPEDKSDTAARPVGSPVKVDKVAVATKHPGVFVVTAELEAETGKRLPAGIELKEVVTPLGKKDSPRIASSPAGRREEHEEEKEETAVVEKLVPKEEVPRKTTRSQKSGDLKVREDSEIEAMEEDQHDAKEIAPKKPSRMQKSNEEEEEGKGVTKTEEAAVEEDKKKEEGDDKKKEEGDDKKGGSASSSEETVSEVEIAHGETDDDSKPQVVKRIMSTRRSRKLLAEQDLQQMESGIVHPLSKEEVSEAESEELLPGEDVESVGSDSTLTTRSRTRRKDQPPIPGRMRAKGGVKPKLGVAATAKGKGRRIIFKKSATKAPVAVARTVTSDRIYYKGQFFTRGDIVSVVDVDGGIYYAQLRGFLTDQYCDKSGVITWLLPTTNSPRPEESFDASTYIIGPEEELPRKLDFFTFVMHAPDDYFFSRNAPYPTKSHKSDQEYLITRAGPKVRLIKDGKAFYRDMI